ncbi:MAG: hypothetical protein AW07_03804 [Candidatus Accumulibacter sp. SK-11]|nr:MAG: hypothetical protein AW07_03804 [Candidatus Accumulibacter sp. SK-11]
MPEPLQMAAEGAAIAKQQTVLEGLQATGESEQRPAGDAVATDQLVGGRGRRTFLVTWCAEQWIDEALVECADIAAEREGRASQ